MLHDVYHFPLLRSISGMIMAEKGMGPLPQVDWRWERGSRRIVFLALRALSGTNLLSRGVEEQRDTGLL